MAQIVSKEDQQYLLSFTKYMERYTSPGLTVPRKPGEELPKPKSTDAPKEHKKPKSGISVGRKWVEDKEENLLSKDQLEEYYDYDSHDEPEECKAASILPSGASEDRRVEVQLDDLPVKWTKSNRNPLLSSFEVIPKSRQIITLTDDDFQPARVPRPVDHKAEEDSEDDDLGDWEILGESLTFGQAKEKKVSYAQAALGQKAQK